MWGRGIRATHLELSRIPPQGGGREASCDQTGVGVGGGGFRDPSLAPDPRGRGRRGACGPPGEGWAGLETTAAACWGDGVWPHGPRDAWEPRSGPLTTRAGGAIREAAAAPGQFSWFRLPSPGLEAGLGRGAELGTQGLSPRCSPAPSPRTRYLRCSKVLAAPSQPGPPRPRGLATKRQRPRDAGAWGRLRPEVEAAQVGGRGPIPGPGRLLRSPAWSLREPAGIRLLSGSSGERGGFPFLAMAGVTGTHPRGLATAAFLPVYWAPESASSASKIGSGRT